MRSSTNRAAVSLAVLVSSVLALGCAAPAQADGGAPTRKTGTIFKHEIDNLIRLIRARAADGPLGGESVEATGKILTAMGHCHRRYHKGDGPVVRPSIEFLIRSRQQDGSFGDVGATVWASAALSTMDPDAFPDEVRQARGWLARHADEVAAR
ncbi:MAG: hypothetical protein KDE27_29455, partial [Planctomycetes bacterium]|nr:hypothetical protein [Planctomycetota bacterium]